MKYSIVFKVLAALILSGIISYVIYITFFKEKIKDRIVEISEDEISELINMDVSFDEYFITDDATTLEITGLVITSPYPQDRYNEINEFETDWINVAIKKVRLVHFDYERLINENHFSAANIEIQSAEIDVYRDKTIPEPPFEHKPIIASLLQKMEAKINVDTLIITGTNIRYFEKSEFSDQSGTISFENLFATGYNITNIKEKLDRNSDFTLDAQANLMGEAKIDAHFIFDLKSENDYFTLNADVAPFQAKVLNTMITGVLPAKITDGKVKGIKVEMEGNEDASKGKIDFEYEDMQFELFNDDSKFKSFITTQAAKLALRKNNTNDGSNYRQGEINFDRRKDKFVFNYWWNSLKSGIVDTMLSDAAKLFNIDDKANERPPRE